MPKPLISVVIPVYGCRACLVALCERLYTTMVGIAMPFEIILVDDRSPDNAWEEIVLLQALYPRVVGVRLSRNFGQHIAITAGLQTAQGEYVAVMDCDLQDPPELIPTMYAKLHEGYDLVLGRRVVRKHSKFRTTMAAWYFGVMSWISDYKIDGTEGSFSLLTRKVVDGYLSFSERERHYLFILRWLGFRQGSVDFTHEQRVAGNSSYSLGRLIRHALSGMFFQTTKFLEWIAIMGFMIAFGGFLLVGYLLYRYVMYGFLEGWTSLFVMMIVSTGVILICLGVVGLYVARIFEQSKQRPLYVIDTVIGQ
ncbi:MAG: glycosyltransferase family 2 protein [Chloroflexales bacterium]|nr:glycosyltransferase family 2 protein [Chloroflexales bacterium]